MRTWARFGVVCSAVLVCAAGALAANPHIANVDPPNPAEGTLLTISGANFGAASGPNRAILMMRQFKEDPRSSIQAAEPGRPIPIVHWQTNRILAHLTGCRPGDYQLAIREYPSVPMARLMVSNAVAVAVRPSPPARAGREEEKKAEDRDPTRLGRPHLTLVAPELCMPGEELNLYGVFPFPDPTTYRAVLIPSQRVALRDVPPQMLVPIEMDRSHARVRVPHGTLLRRGCPPGEYWLRLDQSPVHPSNPVRVIVRSQEPAAWETASHLEGSGAVPCRVEAAVWKLGAGGQFMDILGRGFGPSEGSRLVSLSTPTQLEQEKSNLRHAKDADAPLYPHAPDLGGPGTFWSDTQIRVNLYRGPEKQTGPHFAYIKFPGRTERCSNAVRVVDPQP